MKCNVWLWKVVKKKKNKVGTWGSWIPNTLTSCPFGPNLLYNFSLYIDLCNNQRCFVLVIFSSFFWSFLFSKKWFSSPTSFVYLMTWCFRSSLIYRQEGLGPITEWEAQGKQQNEMNICSSENSKGHQLAFKQWKFKK